MSDIDEIFGKDFFCEHGYAPDLRSHCVPCSVKEATDTLKAENEKLKREVRDVTIQWTGAKTQRDLEVECRDSIVSERDSLRKEVERLSGKTGFCLQCEGYAKQVERLREALSDYAECGDGCTCGDGWDHRIAKEALSGREGRR